MNNIAEELERRRNLVKANVASSFTVYQPVDLIKAEENDLEKGGAGSGRHKEGDIIKYHTGDKKYSKGKVLSFHPEGSKMDSGNSNYGQDVYKVLHITDDNKESTAHIIPSDMIKKSEEDDLEKGKRVPVGTITNGFKKVAEGKWRKVSEHGNTKEEHLAHHNNAKWAHSEMTKLGRDEKAKKYADAMNKHKEESDKLDNTEYGDTDVESKSSVSGGESDEQILKHYKELKSISEKDWKDKRIKLNAEMDTISKFSHNGNDTTYIKKLISENE